LFTRWDAVEAAWEAVMPVLETWQEVPDETFPNYAAGSQGPASADRLLQADGREWRKI
jgi:glucose-6-phosphate 1-dehydrogenase